MQALLRVAILLAWFASPAFAQITSGINVPTGQCKTGVGSLFFLTTPTPGFYFCDEAGVWTALASGGSSLPPGLITFVRSGTCPAGTTEVSALNGKTLIGTVAANGDVGTTGGADSVTPTVANLTAAAQTFTGSSATTSLVSAGTPAGTVAAPVFTGTVNTLAVTAHTVVATKQGAAAGNVVTTATHTITGIPGGTNTAPAFTGSALGTHQHTLTATGANSTSAVTGTLNAIDNRSAFTKVIFCSVN